MIGWMFGHGFCFCWGGFFFSAEEFFPEGHEF
jgi:hypothetical protein